MKHLSRGAAVMSARNAFRVTKRVSLIITLACATVSCGDFVSDSNQIEVALPAQEELVGLIRGMDDVAARVAPALGDKTRGEELANALTKLQGALNAADGPGADRALTDARTAMTNYRASTSQSEDDPPELSAIDFALDRVDGQLQRLCTHAVTPGANGITAPGVAARVVSNQSNQSHQSRSCPK